MYGLSIRHMLSYQYMVGIISGNAMLKVLGVASFMCSLLGIVQVVSHYSGCHKRYHTRYCNIFFVGFIIDHSGSKPFKCYSMAYTVILHQGDVLSLIYILKP